MDGKSKHTYKRLKNGYNLLGAPKLLDVCGVVLSYVAVYNKSIILYIQAGSDGGPRLSTNCYRPPAII